MFSTSVWFQSSAVATLSRTMALSAREAAHARALEAVAAEQAERKTLYKELQRQRRREAGQEAAARSRQADILLWLYIASGQDTALPIAFLGAAENSTDGRIAWEAWEPEIIDRATALEAAAREDLTESGRGISRAAFRTARKYKSEYNAVCWIEDQNTTRGLAPSPGEVLQRLEAPLGTPEDIAPDMVGKLSFAAKKRLQRFRRRWDLSIGRFQCRERLSVDTLRHKVSEQNRFEAGYIFGHVGLKGVFANRFRETDRLQGPFSALLDTRVTEKRTHLRACKCSVKVFAAWKWSDFLRSEVPDDRQILRINIDETQVRFFYEQHAGYRLKRRHLLQKHSSVAVRPAGLASRRRALTHVGIICDDAELQKSLPQVFLGNEAVLRLEDMQSLGTFLPSNFHVWRCKSGWIATATLVRVLGLLAKVLQEKAPTRQVVLFWDAYRVHFTDRVLAALARHRMWPLLIPASVTWLLQPLDSHAFARYKAALRRIFHRRSMALPVGSGTLSTEMVLRCAVEATQTVLETVHWAAAFDGNGFGESRRSIRASVLQELQLTEAPTWPIALPRYADFVHCFPGRTCIPFARLLNTVAAAGRESQIHRSTATGEADDLACHPSSRRGSAFGSSDRVSVAPAPEHPSSAATCPRTTWSLMPPRESQSTLRLRPLPPAPPTQR